MRIYLILLFAFSSLMAKAQLFGLIPINKFEKGYYYDLNNQKIIGKIDIKASSRSILFKDQFILYKVDNFKPEIKVTLDGIKSVVIGADSFIVAHTPPVQFYKVEFDGALKIYSTSEYESVPTVTGAHGPGPMFVGGGMVSSKKTVYLFGKSTDSLSLINRKNFIEVMPQIMADNPEVVGLILNKTYKYGSIKDLISVYNRMKVVPETLN